MSGQKRTVQIAIDEGLLPAAEKAVAAGEFASLDDLASAAVAEFLEDRAEYDAGNLDRRYEELRTEFRRRQARPMSEALSSEEVEKAINDAVDALDLPEHG